MAAYLQDLIGKPVAFATDTIGDSAKETVAALDDGDVALLENLRFDKREKKNDPEFARELASLADLYINDAFGGCASRSCFHGGCCAILAGLRGCAHGKEVNTLTSMLDDPKRPFVAILGGSKVSDKVKVIDALIDKCDKLIIGGGMCFTFLKAQGFSTGTSLMEEEWVERAGKMLEKAKEKGVEMLLPVDVVCADEFANDAHKEVCTVVEMPDNMMGLDIGPATAIVYAEAIEDAKTVFWNGPMGVFEMPSFEGGTRAVAEAVATIKRQTLSSAAAIALRR